MPIDRDDDRLIYLDCSATTPVRADVLEAMLPYFGERFGNAGGAYSLGRKARGALEAARIDVARVLGCRPAEVVFTSGGSESDNLALRGVALAMRAAGRGNHVVTTAIEHEAVLATVHQLEACFGFEATVVGVDGDGRVDPEAVLDAVRPDTAVVSVMLANNEVGTLQPVAAIGAVLRERGVPFHTDAVQAAAYVDLGVEGLHVDLLSLSAHKFYGPKGVGVLYVRDGTPIAACQTGGGQEGGRRSGTQNVAGAVGLARALVLAAGERPAACAHAAALRDQLVARLTAAADGIRLTGHPTNRLPSHASFCIEGAPADAMLLGLDLHGICASSGSACSSGNLAPSHVLTAMGVPAEIATGALRFSLGRMTTDADVDAVVEVLPPLVERLRGVRVAE
ncbi:cysteine desulfurase NifS [bacterium]|nr:MAG: cysteine desulfurase NifS [bacterium]